MKKLLHRAIYISNKDNKEKIISQITSGLFFEQLRNLKAGLYSDISINQFIEEELLHEHLEVEIPVNRTLSTLSDGEKKRALLSYIISKKPDYIIVDNIFDNLDIQSQAAITKTLTQLSHNINVIQITNRIHDILPFISNFYSVKNDCLVLLESIDENSLISRQPYFTNPIPPPLQNQHTIKNPLIKLTNVSVSYDGRPILKNISWEINKAEYWQLMGPNGSGKSTILSMITGDNTKAYGQDILLFGHKKGSGENVWQIKENIGYFTSAMSLQFSRLHSIQHMVISGFYDSVGLYTKPTDLQLKLADEWLSLIGMLSIKQQPFIKLSLGHQRLILVIRAMVKHPPLLILDEPTAGLDDEDIPIFTSLVNKIAEESNTTIIYVSHRNDAGLTPKAVFELIPTKNGSAGRIQ